MKELGPLEEAPAYMIYRLSRLLRQHLKKVLHSNTLDVTPEQYFLLYRLFNKDGVSQSQLADSDLGDYPNITRHIDSLEKKGMVERTSAENDRRKYLIYLTPEGRAQMEAIVPVILEARARLFDDFGTARMEEFKSFVYALQARLK